MFSPTIMLLIGGFTISSALSKTNIDRVLITKVLSLAGTRPSTVLLAFMGVSCFASMWIRFVDYSPAVSAVSVTCGSPLCTRFVHSLLALLEALDSCLSFLKQCRRTHTLLYANPGTSLPGPKAVATELLIVAENNHIFFSQFYGRSRPSRLLDRA